MPDYTCGGCALKFAKYKDLPDCMNGTGCLPGEHIARNQEINQIVSNYLLAHSLPSAERSPRAMESFLDDAGLLDNIELLIELDSVLSEHRQAIQQEQANKAKHEALLKKWH